MALISSFYYSYDSNNVLLKIPSNIIAIAKIKVKTNKKPILSNIMSLTPTIIAMYRVLYSSTIC